MRYSFLEQLICPYCGSDLKVTSMAKENEKELIDGIVSCDCSEYPVLSGILILNLDSLNDLVIEHVKDKKIRKAITICLGFDYFKRIQLEQKTSLILPFPHQLSDIMRYFLSSSAEITVEKKFGRLYDHYSDKNNAFFDLLNDGVFDRYLKYRFSTDSFLSLYPFLPIISGKRTRILDIGCGAGQGSFVLSECVKPSELCCADKCFNLLYLAKKYFVPKADLICLDFNNPLPFKSVTFSSIIMSDALFLVKSRFSFVREIERVLMPDGLSLFLHVHSSLGNDLAPIGSRRETMTPLAWKNMFEKIKLTTIMVPEEKVLKNFLFQNELKLESESAEFELNCSNALIILSSSDLSIFRNYKNVDKYLLNAKNNLIINPIYEKTQVSNKVILSRPSINVDSVGDFYPIADNYLPRQMEIDKSLIAKKFVCNSDFEDIECLIRKFVLLNVPENYI